MGGLTHSFAGVVGIPMPSLFGHDLSSAQLFWLVAATDIACFLVIANLIRGRFGRGFIALRDNDAAARASGVSLVGLKMFAFVISAAITGLAGSFYAVQKTVITPDDFTPDVSIFFLVVVVLGGSGRLWGPAIGTLAFFVVPELLTSLQSWRLLIYGIVLLALMLFAPQGLEGAIRSGWRKLRGTPSLRSRAHTDRRPGATVRRTSRHRVDRPRPGQAVRWRHRAGPRGPVHRGGPRPRHRWTERLRQDHDVTT